MEPFLFFPTPRCCRLRRSALCGVLTALLLLLPSSLPAQGRRSMRSVISRVRSIQNRQRQQMVKQLQTELEAARAALSEAESRLSSSAPELQTARSELEAAKERESAKEQAAHEAARNLHELESKLLAELPADSPVSVTQKELEQAQLELDQEIHRLFSLPGHQAGATEADRASERLTLTSDQKQRLRNDETYIQLSGKIDALHSHLTDLKQELFKRDSAWQEEHSTRQTLARDLKTLEENRKTAAANVARHLHEVKAAQEAVTSAQRVIQTSSSQLTALGAAPKPATSSK